MCSRLRKNLSFTLVTVKAHMPTGANFCTSQRATDEAVLLAFKAAAALSSSGSDTGKLEPCAAKAPFASTVSARRWHPVARSMGPG